MKFTTAVVPEAFGTKIGFNDRILVLGSCFSDEIGGRLSSAGFDVLVNPFGTLYNPASIASAVRRMDSGVPFTENDCVEMGAGAGLICSFEHHTSFARPDATEFLRNANESLERAAEYWRGCSTVIITLGTAMVWRHLERELIVSNCLKRPSGEFSHEMLSVGQCAGHLRAIIENNPGKRFILTVSPIRHLSQGAHVNTLSKATLHLACEEINGAEYFPAYEILCDELRDYRFYAEDLVHPSSMAVEYIWEKFCAAAIDPSLSEEITANEKAARRKAHRPLR